MKTLPQDILTDLETLEILPILKLNPGAVSLSCNGIDDIEENHDSIEETLIVFQDGNTNPEHQNNSRFKIDPSLLSNYQTLPTPEIHQKILQKAKLSEDFVDKLIAFHLGHFTLTLDDLMEYFVHSNQVFAHFAHHCPGFRELTPNDQSLILMSNSTLYFQLHMASYINAGNGLDQVKSLLGRNLPEDLLNCDKFMTISFKYFASAMRLFQDEVWLDTYHHYALRLKNNGLTFDEIAACILFMNPQDPFEEPEKIRQFGHKVLSEISSKQSVRDAMISLRAMVQFYAHGSTPSGFSTQSLINSTEISFSAMPSLKSSDEEEIFWMERQIKKCSDTVKKEINVGTDVINDLVLYCHNQLDRLDIRIEQVIVETLFKRCKIMLSCHPEYRKLSSLSSLSTSSTIIQGISNRIESNFNQAVALLLAYIDTLEPFEQLQLLFGENDCQICPPLSDPMKKIPMPRFEVLEMYSITMQDINGMANWLNFLQNRTTMLTSRLIMFLVLTILWQNDLVISGTHDFKSQIAAIKERYRLYSIQILGEEFQFKKSEINNFFFCQTYL